MHVSLRFDLRNPGFAGTSMADRYAAAIDMAEPVDQRVEDRQERTLQALQLHRHRPHFRRVEFSIPFLHQQAASLPQRTALQSSTNSIHRFSAMIKRGNSMV